jgi:hypothetical protein
LRRLPPLFWAEVDVALSLLLLTVLDYRQGRAANIAFSDHRWLTLVLAQGAVGPTWTMGGGFESLRSEKVQKAAFCRNGESDSGARSRHTGIDECG